MLFNKNKITIMIDVILSFYLLIYKLHFFKNISN